jgi:hypothetical protein
MIRSLLKRVKTSIKTIYNTDNMLSLSPFSEGTSVMDPRFSSRGFNRQRQGPISDSPYLAIALERQVAYDGYKANIDVFLAATANKETYNINIPGIEIKEEPYHAFPLGIPRTVISFRTGVPTQIIENTVNNIKKKCAVTQVKGVKGHANCYLVERPSYAFIKFVKMYVVNYAPKSEGYAQIGEAMEAAKILHYIDLYLRTNTYPAFKSDEDVMSIPSTTAFNIGVEKRPAYFTETHMTKKARYSHVTMTHVIDGKGKEKEERGAWFGKESDRDVEYTAMDDHVFYAKPSPAKDSRASWSAPKDVPSLPGLCFPYFTGMLTHDKKSLRYIPGERFLRMFGEEPKEPFLKYRSSTGGFATSESGIIMTHILAGVDISIDTQTKLHLLFDGQTYLGFCILGAKWAIQRGGMWHLPKTSSDLQADLKSIVTHASSLSEVIDKLKSMKISCSKDCDACDLAEALSEIKWDNIEDEEERKDTQQWFEERVGRLDFGTTATNFGADTLAEVIEEIVDESDGLINHVHFPPASEYHVFKKREGVALARFGYLVPSFVIEKGTNSVRVSSMHADEKVGESNRKMVTKILVSLKPLSRAVKDFQTFRNTKTIFQASGERAAGYRLHTLGGDPKDRFLKRVGVVINALGAGDPTSAAGASKKKAREDEEVVDYVVIDVPEF